MGSSCFSAQPRFWTSRGGTPGAGPQGPGPSTCPTTCVGRRCTPEAGPGRESDRPSPDPNSPPPRDLGEGPKPAGWSRR
eukprot:15481170-Alexandrium_andersonii.AAC.1